MGLTDQGLQRFNNGNNTPALVLRDVKQSSVPGHQRISFGRKGRAYHYIVIRVGCGTRHRRRLHQSSQLGIKINKRIDRKQ
jgi:hypothetical protein